jgi:RHS repeat-associated protein
VKVSFGYDDLGRMTGMSDVSSGDTLTTYATYLPNGEMVGKVNATLTELKIFGSDPSGNLLLERYYTESTTQDPIIEHIYLGNRIVASVTGAGDACFIATVAYGSPLASDLNVFRAFRDRVLRRVAFGEDVIRYYYARGPAAAKWIKHHDYARWGVRATLVAIAIPLKILLFGRVSLLIVVFLFLLCAFVVMKRLGWKRSTALVTTFSLAFSTVMVYYFFVEVPVAHASYTENAKYFYTVDHIGRPLNLRDSNRLLRWYEQHYAFGEIITEATPNGDITAGAGDYIITWTPPFRFPGQYQTADMGLTGGEELIAQNHYREYMPTIGRYNRVDPRITYSGFSIYYYAYNNSLKYDDFNGREYPGITPLPGPGPGVPPPAIEPPLPLPPIPDPVPIPEPPIGAPGVGAGAGLGIGLLRGIGGVAGFLGAFLWPGTANAPECDDCTLKYQISVKGGKNCVYFCIKSGGGDNYFKTILIPKEDPCPKKPPTYQ